MTLSFQHGCYQVRFAQAKTDVAACQRLRQHCFAQGADVDGFDDGCRHLMVADQAGCLVATARLFEHAAGATITQGYAGQFYDLSGFAQTRGPMLEIGRFCIVPDVLDADILRVAWGGLTRLVDSHQIAYLFGCTSFPGVDPAPYAQSFARLAARHLGPRDLLPGVKAPNVVRFAASDTGPMRPLPSLLRTYLAMGGWVSDHAVIDRAMNTLHVFTCLEVASVPPARARALRALAQVPSLP